MPKKLLEINNKKKITTLILGLFFLFFITIFMPLWFIKYLGFSGVGHFFMENIIYILFSIFLFLYFIFIGEYYYKIKIDSYTIQITSYRPVVDYLKEKDYIDISHSMLVDFAFFNRPFSLNKTLMLKIQTDTGKKITKRFNLTLMTKNDSHKISQFLENIIAKNN